MTDIEIINAYKDKTKIYFVGMKEEIKSYLQNRFNDSDSIKESFYRVMNKIKERNIEKYGVDNVFKLKEFHDKSKQTKLDMGMKIIIIRKNLKKHV